MKPPKSKKYIFEELQENHQWTHKKITLLKIVNLSSPTKHHGKLELHSHNLSCQFQLALLPLPKAFRTTGALKWVTVKLPAMSLIL